MNLEREIDTTFSYPETLLFKVSYQMPDFSEFNVLDQVL